MHTPEKLTTENKAKLQEVKSTLNQLNFGHYGDFNERYWDEEKKLEAFKAKIQTDIISEILLLDIQEDAFLTEKEIKKLPEEILRFKNYSEYRGIKYYIIKSQDEILKAFVGVY